MTSALLLLAVSVILLLWSRGLLFKSPARESPRAPRICTFSVVVTTLLALALVYLADSAGRWRLRLSQVQYLDRDESAGSGNSLRVVFGGDAATDSFLLPRFPASFCTVEWDERSSLARLVYHPGGSGGTKGVVAVRSDSGGSAQWRFLGELALRRGDVIEVPLSRDLFGFPQDSQIQPGTLEVVVASSDSLRVGDTVLSIPHPTFQLPILNWGVQNPFFHRDAFGRTFPLQQVLEAVRATETNGSEDRLLPEESLFFSSFLFYKTRRLGLRGDLHLALLDPSVQVRRGTEVIQFQASHPLQEEATSDPAAGATPRPTGTADSPPREVQLHFLGLGRPYPALRDPLERGGVRDLRSGRLFFGRNPGRIAFRLDTPEQLTFSEAELHTLRLSKAKQRSRSDPDLYYVTLVQRALADRAVSFSILPDRFSSGQAMLEEGENGLKLLTPAGELEIDYGEGFWLGDNPQALVQVDEVGATWQLGLLLVCLVVAALALRRLTPIQDPGFDAIWTATILLLLLRFLFSFKAFNRFPANGESLDLSIWSLALIPWCLLSLQQALSRDHDRGARPPIPHLAYGVVAAVVCFSFFGGAKGLVGVCLALATMGLLAVRHDPTRRTIRRWFALPGRFTDRRAAMGRIHSLALAFLPGLILVVGRLLLLLVAGVRERLNLGVFAVALSILYTPLFLYGYARLATFWRFQPRRSTFLHLFSVAFYLFTGLVVVGVIASDFGIPLLLAIPALIHIFSERKEFARPWKLAITVLVPLCYIGPIALLGFVDNLGPPGAEWSSQISWDNNRLRLLQLSYPDSLKEIGRRDSDNLAIMSETIYNYRRTGLLGKGYLHAEVTGLLGPTVLREHVPVVFLAAEFGLAGTLALLAIYLLPAVAPTAGNGPSPRPATRGHPSSAREDPRSGEAWKYFWRLWGWLALLTFGTSSAYMILANYGWVLFTGKNAYLLGLDSLGDVLEGGALLGLGLACRQIASWRREE